MFSLFDYDIRLSISGSEHSRRVIQDMFTPTLELAELFLRSTEQRVITSAGQIYVSIFEACETGYSRQEVLKSLHDILNIYCL